MSRTELVTLDEGDLYVTSKRFVFRGPSITKAVTYKSIVALGAFGDAIVVERSSGKWPHLLFDREL